MDKQQLAKQFYGLIDLGYRPMEAYCITTLHLPTLDMTNSLWLWQLAARLAADTVNYPDTTVNLFNN